MEDTEVKVAKAEDLKVGGSKEFQEWANYTLDHLKPSLSYTDKREQYGEVVVTEDELTKNSKIDAINDINTMLKTGVSEEEIREIYKNEVLIEEPVK